MSYRESSGQTFLLQAGPVLPPGPELEVEAKRTSWVGAFVGVLLGMLLVFVAFGSLRFSVIPCLAAALGHFVGGQVGRRLYARRHAKRARDTTLERIGGRVVVTTHTRVFEMDVAQVRKANWIDPTVSGEDARFGVALVFGEYGAVVCPHELVDVEWRTTEYVSHPACMVDATLFRQLAAAVLPDQLEPKRVIDPLEPEAEGALDEPVRVGR